MVSALLTTETVQNSTDSFLKPLLVFNTSCFAVPARKQAPAKQKRHKITEL